MAFSSFFTIILLTYGIFIGAAQAYNSLTCDHRIHIMHERRSRGPGTLTAGCYVIPLAIPSSSSPLSLKGIITDIIQSRDGLLPLEAITIGDKRVEFDKPGYEGNVTNHILEKFYRRLDATIKKSEWGSCYHIRTASLISYESGSSQGRVGVLIPEFRMHLSRQEDEDFDTYCFDHVSRVTVTHRVCA